MMKDIGYIKLLIRGSWVRFPPRSPQQIKWLARKSQRSQNKAWTKFPLRLPLAGRARSKRGKSVAASTCRTSSSPGRGMSRRGWSNSSGYLRARVSPDRLWRLSEGAQKSAAHAIAIGKTRLPGDDVDRMAALFHHQPGGLNAQVLDRPGICEAQPRQAADGSAARRGGAPESTPVQSRVSR